MPSFDIVSKTDLNEVDNALANIQREIATRFDFKGSKSRIERQEAVLTLLADDPPKLKQMQELVKAHMVRRKVDQPPSTSRSQSAPATCSARRSSSSRASTGSLRGAW